MKNEKILEYSYAVPAYRLTYNSILSSISTFEELTIIRGEVYGKPSHQKTPIRLVTAGKLPTFDFNPTPYFVILFLLLILLLSLVSRLRSSKNTAALLVLSVSAYLNSTINAMNVIGKKLLEQQARQHQEEKMRQRAQPFSITHAIKQTVVNYAEKILWEVWLESAMMEEWNFYAIKFIFITHTKLPPKNMMWTVEFEQVFLINSSTE